MKTTIAIAALFLAAPAFAQTEAGGMPLSQIIAKVEAMPGFASIESVDRDDGHWEVEYRDTDGAEIEVELDPATGEPRAR